MAKKQLNDPLVNMVLKELTKKGFKKNRNSSGFILLLILIALLVGFLQMKEPSKNSPDQPSGVATEDQNSSAAQTKDRDVPDLEVCRVKRCVDGDTLIVITSDGTEERVRFVGSNTPETVRPNSSVEPFGPEASAYTKKRIAEFDNIVTLQSDGDKRDKYGRRLALVYLGDHGTNMLNEELIMRGLARANTQYRYSQEIKDRFRKAEQYAQSKKLGIWSL